ncbi:hypothetical protein D0812_29530 (plasmid) [Vibrio owensii]|uniref:Uncharacterized protein n=6 Tax=Vibrio harveyi group TaxID=717610 RepID=A0ABM6ZS33_9VIBR|nr:hypothetical protein D0812_29530 [Vibrio owensii]TOF54053.1 hypothetical protein CGJ20_24270 [Vibrio parahaemolyticus]TOH11176.1 hypothetical protein CGI87_25255 [Vibrio parahaemolyticus]TOI04950.1 hypothetical protein CGI67_24180 [Vibrio parahaemolyticus]TOJ06272.1 hypothetical protein CGI47_22075 [Vibrio parahaemolyticus]
MANIHYYELMQLVETQRYRHQEWRLLMCKKLEALRAYVAKHLGVESARYNDGEYRYVELFASENKLFHINNDDIVSIVGNSLLINVIMVVAIEFDGGVEPCSCLLQARYYHGSVEFKVSENKNLWTTKEDEVTAQIIKKIKLSLSYNPLR